MAFARFYGHFAAAYGTIWFVLMAAAVLTQSHIDTGEFGLFGFPVIAAIYGLVRVSSKDPREQELARLRAHVARLENLLDAR